MPDHPIDTAKIEQQLNKLTKRQCQILYWVCHGEEYEEIGEKLGYSYQLIQKEMTAVYRLLDLTGHSRAQKRHMLTSQICPIHETMVNDPERDCVDRVIEVQEIEPDPVLLEEVQKDEHEGLIPLRALVHIPQPEMGETLQKGRSTMMTTLPPPYNPRSPFPWILVGILGTLLVVAVMVIAVLLVQQLGAPISKPTLGTSAIAATQLPPVAQVTMAPPSPYPTYPIPATYTPYPTFTPYVLVATLGPSIVAPTSGPEQQDPPPGSIIPAGKSYSYSGIVISTSSTVEAYGSDEVLLHFFVRNARNQNYILRYTGEVFHLKDDTGKNYPLEYYFSDGDRRQYQDNIGAGKELEIKFDFNSGMYFKGTIPSTARHLILTVDQLAGMKNLIWQFDLQ